MLSRILCLAGFLLLFSSCDKVAKWGFKTVTKDVTKETAEDIVETGVKKTAKIMLKDGVKELPKGRTALKVIGQADGSYTPVYNNLGMYAKKYSDEFNKLLLAERRRAISPYDQFPTMSQLSNYNEKLLKLTDKPDANVLRKNLYLAMEQNSVKISKGFGGNAAHHIIEGSDPGALKSRAILKKYGININAPENGILLPENNVSSIYKGSVHMTHHTPEYSELVYKRIENVGSREELISRLQEIKHDLQSGKLNLQGVNQNISKNILK